jgi:tetratricopeptide (TPR) repeat protein
MTPGETGLRLLKLGAILMALTACRTSRTAVPLTPREAIQRHLARGESKQAVELLEKLHAEAPTDFEVARELVEAHVRGRSLPVFIARMEALVREQPTAIRHFMLGLGYFAQPAQAQGPALIQLKAAQALAPESGEVQLRLGLALLESEQYAHAVPALEQATMLLPQRGSIQLPLAKALNGSGNYTGAVAALRRLLEGTPTRAELETGRALMENLSSSFANVPEAARLRLDQSIRWLQEMDVPQEAIVGLEALLREFPHLPLLHTLLGLAYQRLDDAGRALDEFKRAAELAPLDGKNPYYMGELYLSKQRPDAARDAFARALELNPFLDGAYFRLGDLALERRELEKAKALFHKLTLLQPEAAPPRGKLALVLQQQGNYDGADRELRIIQSQRPDDPEFLLRLGVLHTERWTRASHAQEKATAAQHAERWLRATLRVQPDNVLASRALEQISRR